MNELLHKRTSKLLSYVLILATLVPTWMMALMATPAEAQTPHLTVGVVDFRNESGVQGDVLSRLATDAVALELAKQPVFDILSRAQVNEQMKNPQLGLTPPLNKIGLSRLGAALSADAMVEGSIRSVQVRGAGGGRRAAVTVLVRMLDQASGEVINGGIQTGYSNPRVGYEGDDDTLITEAVDNAAFLVVKTMAEYIIPEATVQNSVGQDQVMLNKGSRDGIKRGMRMIVKRSQEIIGYLQIADVTPTDSIATVVKAMRGVKAEDRATAIFDMPAVSEVRADPPSGGSMGAPPAKKSGSKMSKAKNLLLALGAIVGIAALVNGGSGSESPGGALIQQTANGVEVKWNSSRLWGGKNVEQALVWRSDEPDPVAAAQWRSGWVMDTAIDTGVTVNVEYSMPNAEGTGLETNTSEVDPLIPNRTYRYKFSAIYLVNSLSGEETSNKYSETDRVNAGQITFIDPWKPSENNLEVPADATEFNPKTTSFGWRSRQGADRYVIQISTDAGFSGNSSQVWTNVNRPVYRNPAEQSGTLISYKPDSALIQWLTPLSTTEGWRDMFWRVGYANSTDTSFKSNASSYVFSDWKTFKLPPLTGPGLPD